MFPYYVCNLWFHNDLLHTKKVIVMCDFRITCAHTWTHSSVAGRKDFFHPIRRIIVQFKRGTTPTSVSVLNRIKHVWNYGKNANRIRKVGCWALCKITVVPAAVIDLSCEHSLWRVSDKINRPSKTCLIINHNRGHLTVTKIKIK